MAEDYRVNRRSNAVIKEIAQRTRRAYGMDTYCPVPILDCFKAGWIPTLFGKKKLILNVTADDLTDNDGQTEFIDDAVIVTLKRSVRSLAQYGDGRSRMTVAHEIAHGVMHPGAPKSRRAGAVGTTTLSCINPLESAEHQAKVFAPAFLINDSIASQFSSAEEVSAQFGVSLTAATIWVEEQAARIDKAASAARVQQVIESVFPPRGRNSSQPITYARTPCTNCGNPTLIPLGIKYLCHTCDQVSDQFSDGDSFEL